MRIVALHGFGGAGSDFDALASALGRETELEIPGLPLSEPLDCGPDDLLLGYSMGARVALSAVIDGLRCAGLVLIGGTPGIDDDSDRQARRRADLDLAARIEGLGSAAFADEWAKSPIIRSQERMPQPWRQEMSARRRDQPVAGLLNQLETLGQGAMPSMWHRLGEIPVPTLWLVGAEDDKYGRIADRAATLMPTAQVIRVAGAGHAPHLEVPAETARLLKEHEVHWDQLDPRAK
ncbi:MAG: 2-succinyl-6-hydroxy-2,4-cyclohexadiene-1-carboxylate synthase [Myxococcota bacterium]|jgi:2-succinyl-6-hydroxy-2,4-cyclohexadiene-1-carboxylate synthase